MRQFHTLLLLGSTILGSAASAAPAAIIPQILTDLGALEHYPTWAPAWTGPERADLVRYLYSRFTTEGMINWAGDLFKPGGG